MDRYTGTKGKGGQKEIRQLRVSQCQERVPTESMTCAYLPWTSYRQCERGRESGPLPSQAWAVQPVPQSFKPNLGAALARDLQLSEEYILGLDRGKVKMRKEKEGWVPLKGEKGKSLTFSGKCDLAGCPWVFGSSLRNNFGQKSIRSPRNTRVSPPRENPKKFLENTRRVPGQPNVGCSDLVGAGSPGGERTHPRQHKRDKSLLSTLQEREDRAAKEKLSATRRWGGAIVIEGSKDTWENRELSLLW